MEAGKNSYEIGFLNQLINAFWTFLCFAPVVSYWIAIRIDTWFYLFLVSAFLIGLLPERILNKCQMSNRRKTYERAGAKLIRKFVQNGDWLNYIRLNRKHIVINDVGQADKYLKTIAMYERYHWMCFIFFLFTTIHGFVSGYITDGCLIIASNILYNVSAIFLQQYNKMRIKQLHGRSIKA